MRFLLAIFLLIYNTGLLAEPRTITWEDLSPPEELGTRMAFDKKSGVKGIPKVSEFDGIKEQLSMFLEDMNFMKNMQRKGGFINSKLDGEKIKLAGYGTPLSFDGDNVTVTQDRAAIEGWAYSLAVHPTDGSIVVGGAEGQVRRITLGEKK